jgi:hypothetical protein
VIQLHSTEGESKSKKDKKGHKKEKWRKEVTLQFMKIYKFLRNIFSGGPEADAVRIFLPRIGKQGATKIC